MLTSLYSAQVSSPWMQQVFQQEGQPRPACSGSSLESQTSSTIQRDMDYGFFVSIYSQHTLDCKSLARHFFFSKLSLSLHSSFYLPVYSSLTVHHYISTFMGLSVLPTFLHSFPFFFSFFFISLTLTRNPGTNHQPTSSSLRLSPSYTHSRCLSVPSVIFQAKAYSVYNLYLQCTVN